MDRVVITIDVGIEDIGERQVNVRRNLHLQTLIDEIRNRFDILDENYGLRRKGDSDPLNPTRTLEQHDVQNGETLELVPLDRSVSEAELLVTAGERLPISEDNQVYLQEERQGQVYEIRWQPAVIGRADQRDPSRNRLLAVDVSGLRGAEYVSRQHAAILEEQDQYYLESLNVRNPTYINNAPLPYSERHVLQPGDRIDVGRITLVFNQRG
jgi:hypothetical protein